MPNFYTDNNDLKFILHNIDLQEILKYRENNYKETEKYNHAPENYADAIDSFHRVLEIAGDLCANRIAPRAEDVDKEGAKCVDGKVTYAAGTYENLKELTQADLMGAMLPREYGGLNMPVTVYSIMNEMVSQADASLQNLFGLQDIAETISKFGTDEQKAYYLPKFSSGEVDGAMSLTEPDAGSDLQAVQLKARYDKETDKWYLNGMKRFITNGCAKVHLVLARSEEGSKDGRGLSTFVCEADERLVVRRIEDKLGIHGSPTCELQFNDVPAELIGKRRRGLSRYVMSLMNGARVAISTQAIGIAEAAYREGLKYAGEREQFGKSIDKFPAVYEMLLSARSRIAAARVLLYNTCKYVDYRDMYEELYERDTADLPEGLDKKKIRTELKRYTKIAAVLTPLSKAFSTELANKVAYDTIQIHGGTGFMRDFPAERFYRDARITNIYEGTTQLQYVAAIGGVMQKTLAPMMDELSHIPFEGRLRRLASKVDVMRENLYNAIEFISNKHDQEYHDLMAGRLCEMEIAVYVSYLMLRDANIDSVRVDLTERYILDILPKAQMDYSVIMRGDVSIIDNKKNILSY
ncbi:MAG: acyl-CoA dehydrogenase family protein [Verrucomicrobiota bacterium]|nr:acyl-CoA dehydrogenase family protein [Verrucomicrobiota bacterium]